MWRQLRAILVLLHCIGVLGMSLPSPEGFSNPEELKKIEPYLASWVETLKMVGIPEQLTRTVAIQGGQKLEWAEDHMERLFAPYSRYLGVKQSWRMFAKAPPKHWILEIWLEEASGWRCIYRPFDKEARWQLELLEDGRVRGMISSLGPEAQAANWKGLANNLARRAKQDFPDALQLKIQQIPVTIPAPEELRQSGRLKIGEPKKAVVVRL